VNLLSSSDARAFSAVSEIRAQFACPSRCASANERKKRGKRGGKARQLISIYFRDGRDLIRFASITPTRDREHRSVRGNHISYWATRSIATLARGVIIVLVGGREKRRKEEGGEEKECTKGLNLSFPLLMTRLLHFSLLDRRIKAIRT